VLISHNLNDVFEVADDIAVLYLGQMVAQVRRDEVSRNDVVQLITGGAPDVPGSAAPSNGEI
jgi:D-xylose transport system ATP-binding protein